MVLGTRSASFALWRFLMGTEEQPGNFDCYITSPDEPMFILGKDARVRNVKSTIWEKMAAAN